MAHGGPYFAPNQTAAALLPWDDMPGDGPGRHRARHRRGTSARRVSSMTSWVAAVDFGVVTRRPRAKGRRREDCLDVGSPEATSPSRPSGLTDTPVVRAARAGRGRRGSRPGLAPYMGDFTPWAMRRRGRCRPGRRAAPAPAARSPLIRPCRVGTAREGPSRRAPEPASWQPFPCAPSSGSCRDRRSR